MPRFSILLVAVAASLTGLAPADAQQQQPQPQSRPCAAIRQVCVQAGFALNGARAGEGLVVDCIRPIMQGTPQPRRATKPLPAVDPALIEACRARNPGFGMRNAQAPQPHAAPGMAPQDAPPTDEPDEPPQEPPAPKL